MRQSWDRLIFFLNGNHLPGKYLYIETGSWAQSMRCYLFLWFGTVDIPNHIPLGLYSLSGRTSPRKISLSLEAARSGVLWSYRSEIWQEFRQRCCRDVCKISECLERYNNESRGFETSRDLALWRLSALVNGGPGLLPWHSPNNSLRPSDAYMRQ